MRKLPANNLQEQGQTMIETMVAVFVLIMGITAALGLANYSLTATTSMTRQIIGMGLAREGLEAVKNMRDTNWLRDTFSAGCNCYPQWANSLYNIKSNTSGRTYTLGSNPGQDQYWTLTVANSNFGLNFSNGSGGSFYTPVTTGSGNTGFYRRITLTEVQTTPYDSISPRIRVDSDVWWKDRKCNNVATYEAASPSCRIRLTSYLTNWKNY